MRKNRYRNDVLFPSGALIDKGRFYVYYWAADKLTDSKPIDLEELLGE